MRIEFQQKEQMYYDNKRCSLLIPLNIVLYSSNKELLRQCQQNFLKIEYCEFVFNISGGTGHWRLLNEKKETLEYVFKEQGIDLTVQFVFHRLEDELFDFYQEVLNDYFIQSQQLTKYEFIIQEVNTEQPLLDDKDRIVFEDE